MKSILKYDKIIYFLFIIFPIIEFYLNNYKDFFFRINTFYLFVFFYIIFFILVFFIIKKVKLNINLFCIIFFIFFNYYIYQNTIISFKGDIGLGNIPYLFFFIFYILIFLLISILSLKIKNVKFALILAIFIYTNIGINLFAEINENLYSNDNKYLETSNNIKYNKPVFKPQIFYILPDYFIGNPYLEDNFNYKSKLEESLTKLNFNVIKNSLSNGSSTFIAINHIFDTNYFIQDSQNHNSALKKKLNNLWDNTVFYNYFKKNGYDFKVIAPNHIFCEYPSDMCLSNANQFKEFSVSFLTKTPIIYILKKLIQVNLLPPYFDKRHEIFTFIDNFDSLTDYNPSLYYVHTNIAYGRPLKNSDCQIIDNRILIYQNLKEKYLENYKCAEKTLEKLIRKIFKKYGDEIIIIIQSDHGTFFADQGKVEIDRLNKSAIKESFQNFTSFYLPQQCSRLNKISKLSQVNVFRIIYNCIANEDIDYLKDRHFWGFFNSKKIMEIKNLQ